MFHEAGINGGNGNGFMIHAICVSSGREMILRCLRSAIGGGEHVNIDDIPGSSVAAFFSRFFIAWEVK